jgi:hypothetical protein
LNPCRNRNHPEQLVNSMNTFREGIGILQIGLLIDRTSRGLANAAKAVRMQST